jgi:carbon monoxide dehydrogenase subunit G
MEFDNSFTVNAPLQRVWDFLLNVREVAPCMPGAQLTEVVSDTEYKGTVKIKLGAVQISYKGTATISEVDEETHTVVLVASGRETRGTGNASSTTTSRLVEEGPNRTVVNLHSQVDVSGRVAQFGRSIMQDVASRLLGEFARNLEAKLLEEEDSPVPEAVPSSPSDVPATVPTAVDAGAPSETQAIAPRTAAPVVTGRSSPTRTPEPQPIRMLPIVADVARSQVARGLRKLASLVEPKERP